MGHHNPFPSFGHPTIKPGMLYKVTDNNALYQKVPKIDQACTLHFSQTECVKKTCHWNRIKSLCLDGSNSGPLLQSRNTRNFIFNRENDKKWDYFSYNHNVHWNPWDSSAHATGYSGSTIIDDDIK